MRDKDIDLRWWTWAGFKTNATLTATLSEVSDPSQRFDDRYIRLREDLTPAAWRELTADAEQRLYLPEVTEKALEGLKFNTALPKRFAIATLAARLANFDGARRILSEPTRFVSVFKDRRHSPQRRRDCVSSNCGALYLCPRFVRAVSNYVVTLRLTSMNERCRDGQGRAGPNHSTIGVRALS